MAAVGPVRIAKWLGLAYAAGIATFFIVGADGADVVFYDLLFLPWLVGPVLAAAVCAKASRTRLGAWLFLGLEAALIASTGAGWFYLIEIEPHSTNGVAMLVSLPLAQYAAAALFFTIVSIFGWRARREFLEA